MATKALVKKAVPYAVLAFPFLSLPVYAFDWNGNTSTKPGGFDPFGLFHIQNKWEAFWANLQQKIVDLPGIIFNDTVHVLQDLFHMLTTLLIKVPHFVYDSEVTMDLFAINGAASLSLLMGGLMYHVIVSIWTGEKVEWKQFYKIAPLVILGSAVTPYLFQALFYVTGHTADLLNVIMDRFQVKQMDNKPVQVAGFELFFLLLLNAMMIYKAIPIFITNAERWFMLLVNIITAPIQWATLVYTKSSFKKWIKRNVYLVNAHLMNILVLTLLNILMFGGDVTTAKGLMVRMLLVIGGLSWWEKLPTHADQFNPGTKPRFKYSIFKNKFFKAVTGNTLEGHGKNVVSTMRGKLKR